MQFKSGLGCSKDKVFFFKEWPVGGEMAEWLSGGCKVSVKPEKFERAAALCLYTTILRRALKHTLKA